MILCAARQQGPEPAVDVPCTFRTVGGCSILRLDGRKEVAALTEYPFVPGLGSHRKNFAAAKLLGLPKLSGPYDWRAGG